MDWMNIAIIVCVCLALAFCIYRFCKFTKVQQKEKINKWILWAVIKAEEAMGSGTGKIKLLEVYKDFTIRFPFIVNFISFEKFSGWVDEQLVVMREWIEKNGNIASLINRDVR